MRSVRVVNSWIPLPHRLPRLRTQEEAEKETASHSDYERELAQFEAFVMAFCAPDHPARVVRGPGVAF